MRSLAAAVAVVACAGMPAPSGATSRESVIANFGWRHHLGPVPEPPIPCPGIEKGVNYGTGGVEHAGVKDAGACCDLCTASLACKAWDWNPDTQQCWTKPDSTGPVKADRYSGVVPSRGTPAPAAREFNDSSWETVNAPHDMLIVQNYSESNSPSQGFLPRNMGWYRRSVCLPESWRGRAVWLYLEGAFHVTTGWLNGQQLAAPHLAGYTSFALRLDNATNVTYSAPGPCEPESANQLALLVDASFGDGWWYEGGGLTRNYWLTATNEGANLGVDGSGVFASAFDVTPDGNATLNVSVTVHNDAAAPGGAGAATVPAFRLIGPDGALVAAFRAPEAAGAPAGGSVRVSVTRRVEGLSLWSVQTPALYTLETTLLDAASGQPLDAVNTTIGVRSVRFEADSGLRLNGRPLKVRGFCDHSTFGGVGAAVPDRVNLFRAQALRSVGGNAWRMAHNPPVPGRLHIADRLGLLILDENRDLGGHDQQGGTTPETIADELADVRALVSRDRNHPSVMMWSLCNEVGCDNETAVAPFRAAAYRMDGTRLVTENDVRTDGSPALDVQGFSHKHGDVFDAFHKAHPGKPTMATECCSCLSQRGVAEDACPNPRPEGCRQGCRVDCNGKYTGDNTTGVFYNDEISQCTAVQVAYSDSRPFVSGTFVWSGSDYYGESRGWPQVVKCRGAITDVAGFRKASAGWLRAWWLAAINATSDYGRPLVDVGEGFFVRVAEHWVPGKGAAAGRPTRTVHAYTNAASVELLLNGAPAGGGSAQPMPFFGTATWPAVKYAPGNLTAVARDASGAVVASFSAFTPGHPVAVRLSLDAPSPLTGTGDALLADGLDTAMVRAEVVDAAGRVVAGASNEVSFRVVSGQGLLWATHNGDASSQVPAHSPSHPAYDGLARAFVRSAVDASSPYRHLLRRTSVAVPGGISAALDADAVAAAAAPIVVEATSPGLQASTVTIPVSLDPASASPLAAATASAGGLAV